MNSIADFGLRIADSEKEKCTHNLCWSPGALVVRHSKNAPGVPLLHKNRGAILFAVWSPDCPGTVDEIGSRAMRPQSAIRNSQSVF
jgi:hypothetical protein